MSELGGEAIITLELDRDEADLVKAALRLLESTLGREQADELEEVQALLSRLDAASRG